MEWKHDFIIKFKPLWHEERAHFVHLFRSHFVPFPSHFSRILCKNVKRNEQSDHFIFIVGEVVPDVVGAVFFLFN